MTNDIYQALLHGNSRNAEYFAQQELDAGANPMRLVQDVILPALEEVGRRFECNEYFVPELIVSARAAKCAIDVIKPWLIKPNQEIKARVVIGAVCGELHDIGINLIGLMLEGAGFEVVNLGADVRAEKFVEAAAANKTDLVMLSAANFPQWHYLKQTIEALKKSGLREKVKVMVGGSSITQEYADQMGADAYAQNAVEAVRLAQKLTGSN